MDFKTYISALFYLTESLKYTSAEFTAKTNTLIAEMCEEAFANTQYSCFKIYKELQTNFPLISFSGGPKSALKKTSTVLWIEKTLAQEESYHLGLDKYGSSPTETKELLDTYSYITLKTNCYRRDDTVITKSTKIDIDKMKVYDKADMEKIIAELKALGY